MRRTVLAVCLVATLGCRASGGSDGLPPEATARTRRRAVPDVTLHTVEVGDASGRLRIAIHGGPGLDHTYLRPWLDALGDRARLVYVDLRGHGRSTAPPDANGYTIAAAAADVASLIANLSEATPADVIAHAFGAEVALELALRHPERVRRLVLIDPLWRVSQVRTMGARSREVLGEQGYRRVLALTTPQGTLRDPRDAAELFRRLGRMWWHVPPGAPVIARMVRDLRYNPVADEHFIADAMVWDGTSRAAQVRAPTLVISGGNDQTHPPEDARALAELLPHGRYAEVAQAGHLPFIEQPRRFVETAAGFLREAPGAE